MVFNEPILETNNKSCLFVRKGQEVDNSKVIAKLVLLGVHPRCNNKAPIYRRVSEKHLIEGILLSSIEKGKYITILHDGKIIDVFSI